MRPLKFQGVQYVKGDALPVEKMDRARHWKLWTSGLASHTTRGPFDKRKAKAPEAEGVLLEDAPADAPTLDPDAPLGPPFEAATMESEGWHKLEPNPTGVKNFEAPPRAIGDPSPTGEIVRVPLNPRSKRR
jgi:hypothetical protein